MRVDPLRFAVLFPALLAAHTVGDHVVQTDHQAANKPRDWRAMAGHIGGYQATQLVTVAGVAKISGVGLSRRELIAGSLLSALSHALLDRRWPVVRLLQATGSPRFANPVICTTGPMPPPQPQTVARDLEPPVITSVGPLPLHGPYLADQALHTACLLASAAVMAVRR